MKLASLNYDLSISWCPSHNGIPGNEMADFLAKRALKKPQSYKLTSLSFIKRQIKSTTLNLWKSQWEGKEAKNYSGLGRLYRQISQDSLR
ncbi:RNase H family protein, partial [Escherichia coli]